MFRDCEYVKMTHKDKGVWSMEYGVCAANGKKSKKVMETIKKFFSGVIHLPLYQPLFV